jgi:hypothetical protein
MAKSTKPGRKKGGPYLAAAFFCEKTIEDKQDGSLSAIRIIDQMDIVLDQSAPPDVPSETNRIPVLLHVLLSFKTGDSPGHHTLRLILESPSGKSEQVFEETLPFSEAPQGGANLRINTTIQMKKDGLFWTHVFLDGKCLTSMPFHISVRRANVAGEGVASTDQGEKK